jgi:hypothetical protein
LTASSASVKWVISRNFGFTSGSGVEWSEHRVSRTLKIFQETATSPIPARGGRPRKSTDEILDLIEARTRQTASLPSTQLAREVQARFGVQTSSGMMEFHFRPSRHCEDLRLKHIEVRFRFCQASLRQPQDLRLMHFSDESRLVLGDNQRWIWYPRGEGNESTFHMKQKLPPSLSTFAMIGND